MLVNTQSVSNCRSEARFCVLWGLVTSLGTVLGIAAGFSIAVFVGIAAYLLTNAVPWLSPFALVPSVAAVGAVTGSGVGTVQSFVLPWPRAARGQWLVRSLFGWAVGAGLGAVAATLVELQLRGNVSTLANSGESLMMVIMTPILGLVLGLALRPAVPAPAPNLILWLAANVAATSLGWIIAWPFAGTSTTLGLSWTGVVLGPLVYAMISGAMMVWIERRRLTVTLSSGS